MKKILLVLISIIIIAIVSVSIFLMTLDLNQYRGIISEKISSYLDKDTKIGEISLVMFPKIGFRLNGFFIKNKGDAWENSILKLGSIEASVKILPLLKKDIQIERLTIRGLDILISKDMFLKGPRLEEQGDGKDVGLAAAGAIKFLARSARILDSTIKYKGQGLDLELDIVEALVNNISLYGPSSINARISLFGKGKENIALSALLYPEIDVKKPYLKNLDIKIDLAHFNISELVKAFGESTGIEGQLPIKEIKGDLGISSRKIYLDSSNLIKSDLDIELSGGSMDLLSIKDGLKDVSLKMELLDGVLTLHYLKGLIAGGSFFVKGDVKNISLSQDADLSVMLKDIKIDKFMPGANKNKFSVEGELNIDMESRFSGFEKDKVIDTFNAKGNMSLDNLVLIDMNVLRIVFDKLDMLPGLASKLEDSLPERYKEILEQKNTYFKPIKTEVAVSGAKLLFKDLAIESDAFYVVSKDIVLDIVSYDFAGSRASNLFIPQDLSEAFIGVVNELRCLTNDQGMITMPLTVYGRIPNLAIAPDLDYVINRLAVFKGAELLGNVLNKNSSEGPAKEGDTGKGGESPEGAIIKTIFDIISSPKE